MALERFFGGRRRWRCSLPAYAAVLAVSGVVVAPITVVPVLPVETLARITGAVGGDAGIEVETREVAELPQLFADRFGWKGMARGSRSGPHRHPCLLGQPVPGQVPGPDQGAVA